MDEKGRGKCIDHQLMFFDNQWPLPFHHFDRREQQLADAIGAYWTNLARFGDPNGGPAPLAWPETGRGGSDILFLDEPLASGAEFAKTACDFWRTHHMKFDTVP